MLKALKTIILFLVLSPYAIANGASIEQETLAAHNKYRALHHSPKLEWDSSLASYAQHYATKCKFKHSSSPYGENLAAGYPTVTAAVNAWYAENEHYSYLWPGFSYKTGHFTQVVWMPIFCSYH